MNTLDTFAGLLLERLAWTSLQALLLVGAVALVIRLRPQLSAATRCLLWWLVGLQLVVGMAWQSPVELPWLATAQPAPPVAVDTPPNLIATANVASTVATAAPSVTPTIATDHVVLAQLGHHWRSALLLAWLACLAVLLRPSWYQCGAPTPCVGNPRRCAMAPCRPCAWHAHASWACAAARHCASRQGSIRPRSSACSTRRS